MQQLLITLSEDGRMNVNGPIKDRLLCKGMLAEASRIIDEWHAKQAAGEGPKIVRADGPIPPFSNGNGGRHG